LIETLICLVIIRFIQETAAVHRLVHTPQVVTQSPLIWLKVLTRSRLVGTERTTVLHDRCRPIEVSLTNEWRLLST